MDDAGLELKPTPTPAPTPTPTKLPYQALAGRAKQLVRTGVAVSTHFRMGPSPDEGEAPRSGWNRALFSYLVVVLAPVLVYFLYAAAVETRGYVSETRITVQAAPKKRVSISASSTSMLSRLIGAVSSDTDRDSYIALNYVKSAALIQDLGGRPVLERYYSKPDIDYFSRLPPGRSIEDLLEYWRSHISANIDTISGLLTIKITAYSPDDALEISKSVNALSEKLINQISLRVREDALEKAKREVVRASNELGARREALLAFRNSNELIDPAARAKSIGEMIGKLTLEKISIETSLNLLIRSNASNAPSVGVLNSKLASFDQQIEKLKSQLTTNAGGEAISAQLAGYEGLKLQEEFASKVYGLAEESYVRALQELQNQQLYLSVVVSPILAEEATYPRITASTLLLAVCLTIFWSIFALIVASMRDQID